MNKIEKYDVVSSIYLDNITKRLNEKISEGWQPFGHLILGITHTGEKTYSQPIVKYVEKFDSNIERKKLDNEPEELQGS